MHLLQACLAYVCAAYFFCSERLLAFMAGIKSQSRGLLNLLGGKQVSRTDGETVLPKAYNVNIKLRYRFLGEIGKGYYGVVRVVKDKKSGELLACKTMLKAKLKGRYGIVRREVTALLQLAHHENIVHFRGAYEDATSVHIVLELCEAGDLCDEINRRSVFNEKDASVIFRQIVKAVAYSHAHGFMHRDLKPENILLQKPDKSSEALPCLKKENQQPGGWGWGFWGRGLGAVTSVFDSDDEDQDYPFDDDEPEDFIVKLGDFGQSVQLKAGEKLDGQCGSLYYVSPEMVQGKRYGFESDIWSLGIILWAMLAGRLPFKDGAKDKVHKAICRGRLNFSAKPWPLISSSAKDLIRQMLCQDPAKRLTAEGVLRHPWLSGDSNRLDKFHVAPLGPVGGWLGSGPIVKVVSDSCHPTTGQNLLQPLLLQVNPTSLISPIGSLLKCATSPATTPLYNVLEEENATSPSKHVHLGRPGSNLLSNISSEEMSILPNPPAPSHAPPPACLHFSYTCSIPPSSSPSLPHPPCPYPSSSSSITSTEVVKFLSESRPVTCLEAQGTSLTPLGISSLSDTNIHVPMRAQDIGPCHLSACQVSSHLSMHSILPPEEEHVSCTPESWSQSQESRDQGVGCRSKSCSPCLSTSSSLESLASDNSDSSTSEERVYQGEGRSSRAGYDSAGPLAYIIPRWKDLQGGSGATDFPMHLSGVQATDMFNTGGRQEWTKHVQEPSLMSLDMD